MENELRAPRDGTVERVAVAVGQTVELGDSARRHPMTPARPADGRSAGSGPRPLARDAPGQGAQGRPGATGPVRDLVRASSSATSTPPPTRPGSTRIATSAGRASTRSPGASSRRCTAAASGRCASTPASPPPRRRTGASATSSSRARPACRSRSTCRRRWATTRTRRGGGRGRPGRRPDLEPRRHGRPARRAAARRRQHLDDDQRDRADPAGPLRRGRRGPGRRAGGHLGHDPERHPQGVHRPRHVHLPAAAVDAPGDRRLRVLRARAAQVEHDLDLGLPHARGRGDRRPGARLHPGRRDRLRRGRRRAGARCRRLRRPAQLLLRRLVGAVRGGRQVPGRPADVGRRSCASGSGRPTRAR